MRTASFWADQCAVGSANGGSCMRRRGSVAMEGLGGKVAAHARWTDDLAWRRSALVGVAAMAAGSDCQKNQDDRQNIERGDPVGRIELEQREKRDDAAHNCRDRQRVVEPASVNCTHRSSLGHMRDHEVIRVSHLDLAKAKGLIHVSSRIVSCLLY